MKEEKASGLFNDISDVNCDSCVSAAKLEANVLLNKRSIQLCHVVAAIRLSRCLSPQSTEDDLGLYV